MPIYTGVADANGDFNISFGSNSYTSGEKITVTAEKDSAEKTIELYAPSEPTGGGVIQFSGTLDNFPQNIGGVKIIGIAGAISANAFSAATAGVLWRDATSLEIGAGVTSIGDNCFSQWGMAQTLILPNTLLTVGQGAFSGLGALKDLIMPNSITGIGMNCFSFCSNLENLTLSNSLTLIPVNAFANNAKLKAVYLPDSVIIVQNQAFLGCRGIKSVRIGPNCTSLGGWSFNGMIDCDVITCERTTPPTMVDNNSFENLKSTCVFKVPAGSVAAYQSAPGWSAFAARIQAI